MTIYIDVSKEFIEWVLVILNTPNAWQFPKTRLKVLCFFYIFPKNTFNDHELGSRVAHGLINAGIQLEMNV